jgi:hypothetical protein
VNGIESESEIKIKTGTDGTDHETRKKSIVIAVARKRKQVHRRHLQRKLKLETKMLGNPVVHRLH